MNPCSDTPSPILILGLGLSGRAAADLALNRGFRVEARDTGNHPRLQSTAAELRHCGATVYLGEDSLQASFLAPPALAVISPGIAAASALGEKAAEAGCPIIDEFEFGARYCRAPLLLAVTGSNGKTTTVEMAVHCLRYSGLKVMAAGNIGRPMSEIAQLPESPAAIIAELSSFQLERCYHVRTHGAALLNLSSDHLDRHGDLQTYLRAKLKIFDTIERADQAIIRDDLLKHPSVNEKIRSLPGKPVLFSSTMSNSSQKTDFFLDQDDVLRRRRGRSRENCTEVIIAANELPFPGKHNLENVMAALALSELAGLEPRTGGKALRSFQLDQHRMQTIPGPPGIRIINDSKSTNPDSLRRALQSLFEEGEKSIILIAGGLDKKMDFSCVKPWLKKAVKVIVCTGDCGQRLALQWAGDADCVTEKKFDQAVTLALASANLGDTVLLSPGCASQDAFIDYTERGRRFIELTSRELKK